MNEANCFFDIHDSEIERVGEVLALLRTRQARPLNLEAFRREVIERFAEANIKAQVRVYETNQEGMYAFDVDLLDRIEGTFDPERQVHEVTNDILGLGEGGVIKTGGLSLLQGGNSHSHGGHGHKH